MKKLNKILLIDDDEVTNYINKDLLEGLDIAREVQVIEDGEQAYEYLARCGRSSSVVCPEFIIFDHQMPHMDGKELIEALAKINFIKEHKVVFMFLGVSSIQTDVESMKELGVQEFTIKPLSEAKVMEVYSRHW